MHVTINAVRHPRWPQLFLSLNDKKQNSQMSFCSSGDSSAVHLSSIFFRLSGLGFTFNKNKSFIGACIFRLSMVMKWWEQFWLSVKLPGSTYKNVFIMLMIHGLVLRTLYPMTGLNISMIKINKIFFKKKNKIKIDEYLRCVTAEHCWRPEDKKLMSHSSFYLRRVLTEFSPCASLNCLLP